MPRQDVLPLQVFFALFELQLQLQSARVYFTNLVSLFCLSVYVAFPYSHSQTVDSDAPPPSLQSMPAHSHASGEHQGYPGAAKTQ